LVSHQRRQLQHIQVFVNLKNS